MGEETVATDTGREVGGQAVALLQELIRIDTANPPGNEEQAQRLLAETLTAAGFDCELLAAEPGRPEPGRAAGRGERRADAVPAGPRRHGPGRSLRVELRSLGGRRRERGDTRPGRSGHEGPGRRRGGRRRRARPRRLAPPRGRAPGRRHRRRGDGSRGRGAVALQGASRQGAVRLRAQRGRGHLVRARWAAVLPALRGREGTVPVLDPSAGRRRPRLGPRAWGTTRS